MKENKDLSIDECLTNLLQQMLLQRNGEDMLSFREIHQGENFSTLMQTTIQFTEQLDSEDLKHRLAKLIFALEYSYHLKN